MISAASHPSTESRKMNSSTSSKSSPENQQNSAASSSLMLPLSSPPFSFIHSAPFFKQPFNLNPNFPLLTETTNVVREVQNSIFCNVDKCLRMLHDFRSPNLVHDKIMRLFYHIHTCCQIPYGKGQNFVRLSKPSFAAILPGDSVAGIVVTNGVLNFLNIYNTLLVVRLVLTWFPNAPPAVVSPLSTLCDPYLNIFRGIIPPLGGTLDLSPILAFLVLNAFTSTASALPAELPPTHDAVTDALAHHTASRQKWMQRLATAAGDKSSGQV